MSGKRTILTIDDNRLIHTLVHKTVGHEYNVITASNGQFGVEVALAESPDIILLDVEMPGMSGFEVCSHLKAANETADIPVIFLSSLSDERSRLKGFDVGAVDFLVKPFKEPELLAKLESLTKYQQAQEELNGQAKMASSAAFAAMKGSNELGMAIHFIEASYGVTGFDALAKAFFSITSGIGLDCSLMYDLGDGECEFYSSVGLVSPLEQEVISTIFEKGERFTDFSGSRTQINYMHVALLVKNMPIDDDEKYGRFKDFLPTMLGAINAKIHSLLNEQAMTKHSYNIGRSFSAVKDTLGGVGADLEKNQNDVVNLLQGMLKEFESRIPTMGLDDDQEAYLINRLDETITKAYAIIDSSTKTSHAFKTVSRLLEHISEKQQKLAESMAAIAEDQSGEALGNNVDDVELF